MIDIHCHLENKYYNNIEEIIEKCKKNNIEKIIVSGYDLESSIEAVELSNTYDNVYATIGYLPEVIYENKIDDIKELEKLIKLGKVVGIGEIGLDYHWYQENKEKQKELMSIEEIKSGIDDMMKKLDIKWEEALKATIDELFKEKSEEEKEKFIKDFNDRLNSENK